MKVLLDENLDRRLRSHLGAHDIFTASYMGWNGLTNGKLLDVAELDRFAVLLTGDRTMYKEQNLAGRKLAVVALSSVEWLILNDHLPKIAAAIDRATPGSYQSVDCGTFDRRRTGFLSDL